VLSQNDLDWYAARLAIAVHETRRLTPQMAIWELKQAFPGLQTVSLAPNGNQIFNFEDKSVEVGPMASNDEIKLALENPFVRTENTRLTVSLKDRLQEKARLASSIVSNEVKALEDGMDAIIAEKDAVAQKRQAAIAATSDVLGVVKDQWDGIKSSVDILSNGAPE
jgi:hypothetical protein